MLDAMDILKLELQKCPNRGSQILTSVEKFQFNEKLRLNDFSTHLREKLARRKRRSAGCKQIVYDHHAFSRFYRVFVNLNRRLSVFERITLRLCPKRELSFLANRDKTQSQLVRDHRTKYESAGIDPGNLRNLRTPACLHESVCGDSKQRRALQNRSDVLENNPRFREILNVADGGAELLEIVGKHGAEVLSDSDCSSKVKA